MKHTLATALVWGQQGRGEWVKANRSWVQTQRVFETLELQGQEEEEPSFPTNNPRSLKFIVLKTPVVTGPLANSTKHLCLSLKPLPSIHRPMGQSSNEMFNKSPSKVIYSPLGGKKWEKPDSMANL